jgi:hypothetical protein
MMAELLEPTQICGVPGKSIFEAMTSVQGYPMSMLLFTLCVDPLLRMLEMKIPAIRVGKRVQMTVVVVYADDVTIFITTPTDLHIIRETIHCNEKATG